MALTIARSVSRSARRITFTQGIQGRTHGGWRRHPGTSRFLKWSSGYRNSNGIIGLLQGWVVILAAGFPNLVSQATPADVYSGAKIGVRRNGFDPKDRVVNV